MKAKISFFLVLTFLLAGCQPGSNTNMTSNTNTQAAANAKWDAYVEQFLNGYFAANPTSAVYQGKHEFDGKLPDWSEDGLKKEIARLKGRARKSRRV